MKDIMELGLGFGMPLALILTVGIAGGMDAGSITLLGGAISVVAIWLPVWAVGYAVYGNKKEVGKNEK